jgi:hypothetical protein
MPMPRIERSQGIIFKNLDLLPELDKTNNDGSVTLPGLGLDKEILDLLKQGIYIYCSGISS